MVQQHIQQTPGAPDGRGLYRTNAKLTFKRGRFFGVAPNLAAVDFAETISPHSARSSHPLMRGSAPRKRVGFPLMEMSVRCESSSHLLPFLSS